MRPEQKVLSFLARHPLEDLYISSVSLAELCFGVEIASEGSSRRDDLNKWLAQEIRPMFDRRVLPITEDAVLRWRILIEAGRRAGHTCSQPDLIIAATALHHNLKVATRDRSDFKELVSAFSILGLTENSWPSSIAPAAILVRLPVWPIQRSLRTDSSRILSRRPAISMSSMANASPVAPRMPLHLT